MTDSVAGTAPGRRRAEPAARRKLGTFGGVFTPSILTILGVIMYLRFGWVVGSAGLRNTLVIVTLATAITLLTGLSIAQVATDQVVRTGGVYYMVSRSLGIEIGGAIGVPLYLAQALSVALYTLGFAESVNAIAPWVPVRTLALVTTVLVTVLALVSAHAAIRAQYVIMAAIAVSLVSFFLGGWGADVAPGPPVADTASFWEVFAVFFPAVTGIMAGVNMSGDLADPRRSIPRGTLAAIGLSYALYMIIPVVLNRAASQRELVDDPLIMRQIALVGPAILIGVWGATLSSALGSILGAPRILQALARDGVLPRALSIVGRGSGPGDEPRVGTFVSLALVLAVVAVGDLDAVAPVLTMFFLVSYAMINIVSAGERFLRNPSFRPTFKVHWSLSLLGAIGCVGVMFLINPLATIVAFAIVVVIWAALSRRQMRARWGDIRQGLWLALVRWSVARVRPSAHVKSWRPNVLALVGSPTKRWYLIELADALTHQRGLLNVATILPEATPDSRKIQLTETLRDHLADHDVDALVRVVAAPSTYVGATVLVEAYGLGSLVPNTVVLGDGRTTGDREEYTAMLARFHRAGRNVVVVRASEPTSGTTAYGRRRRIDIWLRSMRDNGALMIALADTLRSSRAWRRAGVTIRMVTPKLDGFEGMRRNLEAAVERARLLATVEIVIDARPLGKIISEHADSAHLTFVGLPDPCVHGEEFPARAQALFDSIQTSRPVAFVLGSADIDLSTLLE